MDAPNSVQVLVRARPSANFAGNIFSLDSDTGRVDVSQGGLSFHYDRILDNSTQEAVFMEAARPMVLSCLDGYNGTIMAYGQTGAGKTHTMCGAGDNYAHRGLIPRVVEDLFKEIRRKPQVSFTVRVSFLELYNEQMADLLDSVPGASAEPQSLQIVEANNGSTHVKGLTHAVCSREEEALALFFEGETNRAMASHVMNKSSSRSHCMFTLHVESRSRVESNAEVLRSKFHLVDLAGSERVKKTNSQGQVLQEARFINKSLTFLEQVVIALGDSKRTHVPYRQTQLTNILKDSIGGNCRTLLIANIWPETTHITETLSTLRFAARMMGIKAEPVKNVHYNDAAMIAKLKKENKTLRAELAMHDSLSNRSHVEYDAYNEKQRWDLQQSVRAFLDGGAEPPLHTLRHMREILQQVRGLWQQEKAASGAPTPSPINPDAPHLTSSGLPAGGGVGEVASGPGKGIGVAQVARSVPLKESKRRADQRKKAENGSDDSRSAVTAEVPPSPRASKAAASKSTKKRGGKSSRGASAAGSGSAAVGKGTGGRDSATATKRRAAAKDPTGGAETPEEIPEIPEIPPTPEEVFETFKLSEGAELVEALADSKAAHSTLRAQLHKSAGDANTARKEMGNLRIFLDQKEAERPPPPMDTPMDAPVVVDEEEFAAIESLRAQKRAYKEAFAAVNELRGDVTRTHSYVTQAGEALITAFDGWYTAKYGQPPRSSPEPEKDSTAGGKAKDDQSMDKSKASASDLLDDGERFEQLELARVAAEDPESLAFHRARVKMRNRGPLAHRSPMRGRQ